jgi:KRAB domain-containing zinc finger protein
MSGSPHYFCAVCEYNSANSSNVKTHVLRHTGEKPFTCQYCYTSFRYNQSLKMHLLKKHDFVLGTSF